MTTTFTATNGVTVTIDDNGYLLATADEMCHATGGADLGVQALREYFQHERDQELGRWRSKNHPDYVVYPVEGKTREVRVTNEATGVTRSYRDHPDYLEANSQSRTLVAREYFAAHPEQKPWHSAEANEAWVITTSAGEQQAAYTIGERHGGVHFETPSFVFDLDDPQITHATRLWPTGDDDER